MIWVLRCLRLPSQFVAPRPNATPHRIRPQGNEIVLICASCTYKATRTSHNHWGAHTLYNTQLQGLTKVAGYCFGTKHTQTSKRNQPHSSTRSKGTVRDVLRRMTSEDNGPIRKALQRIQWNCRKLLRCIEFNLCPNFRDSWNSWASNRERKLNRQAT